MKDLLQGSGDKVTLLTGVQSYETDQGSGKLHGLCGDGSTRSIDCSQYDVAFVDGQLPGCAQGPELVKILTAFGVACCGISTEGHINAEIIAQGAKIAAKKACVFAALFDQKLSSSIVQKPTRSEIARLASMEKHFSSEAFETLRQETDAMLSLYL